MQDLSLQISKNHIWGSGKDIVSPFTFEGRVREDGAVELIKQYQDRHSVVYVGQYDGEGTLAGTWDIHGYRGQWSIKFLGPAQDRGDAIEEIQPLR